MNLRPQCSKKSAAELKPKPKLLRYKNTVHIATFNVRSLNRVNQLPELAESAIKHYLDTISIQDDRYYHSELEIKYHYTGNEWTIVLVSVWKKPSMTS